MEKKENAFEVNVPGGKLLIGEKGCINEYPGVFVTFAPEKGKEELVAAVEYDEEKHAIQTVCYRRTLDEPAAVVTYDGSDKYEDLYNEGNAGKYYMVFICSSYVRDAQCLANGKVPDGTDPNNADNENLWADGNGNLCVLETYAGSPDEIRNQIRQLYPDADDDIFLIYEMEQRPRQIGMRMQEND